MSYTDSADGEVKRKKAAKPNKGMAADEFQNFIYEEARRAVDYVQTEVSEARKTATDYYKGRMPDVDTDDAEEDRSSAVLTEVRDTVLGITPDLMRVMLGGDSLVRFDPVAVEDPEKFAENDKQARIATDYINNVVIKIDNTDYFTTFHSVFQDALVRKTGFVRWFWEKGKKPVYSRHTNLTKEDVLALTTSDDGEEVDIVEKTTHEDKVTAIGDVLKYDVLLRRYCPYGKARLAGVPCEQIVVSPKSTSMDRTTLMGFVDDTMTVSDFVALGLIDDVKEIETCDQAPEDEMGEATARQPQGNSKGRQEDAKLDPTQRPVQYGEFYVTCDVDGDGIAELRRVVTAGTRFQVLENEPWDDVDFAAFCPYPEAYSFFGESVADLTMDIQRIKSRMLRDTLDSLSQSVKPQTVVIEGQVNLDDVLSPDTSNIIRARSQNAVTPFIIPFVGKEALPMLDFMTNTREARTGMSDASQGLDPAALQSTDKDAVTATLTKADARIELIARIFAETGMKRIFRGLLKLIHKHQSTDRMALLNGKPVKISPKSWNTGMEVVPNIPLGRGGQQQQLGFLTGVLAKQQELLTMLGPKNPLVSIDQFFYTLKTMLGTGGWHNAGSFFTDPGSLDPQQRQQLEQSMMQAMQQAAGGGQSQQGPAVDPQVEQAKIASKEKIEQAKIQQEQWMMMKEFELQSAKIRADFELAAMLELSKRTTTLDGKHIDAMITAASDRLASATKIAVERLKPRGGSDTGAKTNGSAASH